MPPTLFKTASFDRLACLIRHWTWADEALARFEQELGDDWSEEEEPAADHPFGAYYHWAALLCALSEAVIEHHEPGAAPAETLHSDLEALLPDLRAHRQLLVAIPTSLERRPRVVALLGDHGTLARLRRLHAAFGDALRAERAAREIDSLDQ